MQFKDFRIIFACTQQAKCYIKINFCQSLTLHFYHTTDAESPNATV